MSAALLKKYQVAEATWQVQINDARETMANDPSLEDANEVLSFLRTAYEDVKLTASPISSEDNIADALGVASKEFHSIRKMCNLIKSKAKVDGGDSKVSRNNNNVAHLRKMDCPKWDGSIRKYLTFRKNFKSLVEDHMSNDLALNRLREDSLEEDSRPYLLVSSKVTLADAWKALDTTYGRADSIKMAVIKDVKDLPMVKLVSDSTGLRHLVTELVHAREDLKACKRESALGEHAFSLVMEKIPDELRRKIDEKILSDDLDAQDSVELLIETLEVTASVEELHHMRSEAYSSIDEDTSSANAKTYLFTPSHRNQAGGEQSQGGQSSARSSSRKKGKNPNKDDSPPSAGQRDDAAKARGEKILKCILHSNNSHQTSECRLFLGKSAAEKKKILIGAKCCTKCFQEHESKNCTSRYKCSEPNCTDPSSHHTMIHAACLAVTLTSSQVRLKSTKPRTCAERQKLAHYLGKCTVRPSHFAYLAMKKQSNRELVKASLLYDQGATLSQILNSVAEKVGLAAVNEIDSLMMRTAGNTEAENWGKTKLYNVPLYDAEHNLVTVLHCVGVDYIGELDDGTYEDVAVQFLEEDVDSESLLTPASGTIQILVGNNHAGIFPKTLKVKGNVVWAETLFGDIIHDCHEDFFPVFTNAEGLLMSTALDAMAIRDASCLVTSICKNAKSATAPLVKVKARSRCPTPVCTIHCMDAAKSVVSETQLSSSSKSSTSVTTSVPTDVHEAKVNVTKTSEETAFDRMCAVEDTPTCYRCHKCEQGTALDKEEQRRNDVYRSCLTYDEKRKRFYCRMPWKENFLNLPDNRPAVIRRLLSLMKSLVKQEGLDEWYVIEFEKLIESGILIEVTDEGDEEWRREGGRVFYVCHFAHLNDTSASTPLRIVFDPTLSFQGVTIDALWEHPPNLIPPIPMLLLRFQERLVPIAMDISKAYWSVYLEDEESHLHRVVWNKLTIDNPIKTYRMLRNSWGMRPAGSMCSVAMITIAEMHRNEYPDVYEFIKNNMYVDDGTSSVDDVTTAIKLARDVSHVLDQASFKIKHFIIGGRSIDITSEDSALLQDSTSIVRRPDQQERVLGLLYYHDTDEISLCARINFSKKSRGARIHPDIEEKDFDAQFPVKISLRMYLSVIATIYDPTGLCSPFTIVLKFELRRIFALNLGWDKAIPDGSDDTTTTTSGRCKELIRAIYDMKKVRFSRCLTMSGAVGNPSLVLFSDSSTTAYACAAYYNWQLANGKRASRLAMAKARPWPKSPVLTVPKGEMMGCVLAVRMRAAIVEKSSYTFDKVILITDSTIVLGQMRHQPYKYTVWTANRLDEIQRLSSTHEWHHIESSLNVADEATRGMAPSEIGRNSRWQNGPEFMTTEISTWPITSSDKIHVEKSEEMTDQRLKDPRMEIRRQTDTVSSAAVLTTSAATCDDEVTRTLKALDRVKIRPLDEDENWLRAKRRISRVIRFTNSASKLFTEVKIRKNGKKLPSNFSKMKSSEKSKWLSVNDDFVPTKVEMKIAELYLIRCAQKCLPSDVKRRLATLNPVQDTDGIWRVKGRTEQVVGNPPILIPKDHALAKILVRHFHGPQHSGTDATLARLREEFWITGGLKFCNAFVQKCSHCRYLRKDISQIEIAPRKVEQLIRSPVFKNITVDLAGPYMSKADRRTTRAYQPDAGKIWMLVIVCRSSQACHLELAEGYDTAAFLAAFDAFTKIRGKPATAIADLGSQIRSAAGVMESLWKYVNIPKIRNYDTENVSWTFVPSGAHSSLGQAERMVQTVKRTMEAVLHSRKPELTKLHFSRMLYSIADMVNDRPLGVHRTRVGKLDADRLLRPNDLLLGRSTSDISPIVNMDCDMNSDQRLYTKILAINEAFLDAWWRKWYDVIFQQYFPREKWTEPSRQIRTGDIVLIRETGAIRNVWTWGEVHGTMKSSDSVVRKATVRYKSSNNTGSHSKYVTKSVRDLCVILKAEEQIIS